MPNLTHQKAVLETRLGDGATIRRRAAKLNVNKNKMMQHMYSIR
jgi:hypothetical protein